MKPKSGHTCGGAAQGGHLELLQWARAQNAPWDKWTCMWAARGGHLALLQWARAQGAPWDERTCPSVNENFHQLQIPVVVIPVY